MVVTEDITRMFRGEISFAEPLAKYTTFRIGGPADYYIEPADKEDLLNVVTYFREQGFSFIIVGNGSNVLVSDEGYRGAAINLEKGFREAKIVEDPFEGNIVVAGAGIRLAEFVDFCIQHDFRGVEMLAGIPGTLGGAVIMNAGAYGGEISDFMVEVELIRGAALKKIKKDEGGFAYRKSGLERDIVVGATFRFLKGDKEEMMRVRKELLIRRKESQPVNLPNAGSIFKNPPGTFAAKLIQECGLKGTKHGGAEISDRHANFIVNKENASANDVLELIKLVRQRVFEMFAMKLDLEVKLIGFSPEVMKEVTW
jgi:UDP-N-acetylmuramate dehydrogenase